MLEPWRSRYLGAMGIVSYVPRAPLPGAAPSVLLPWDESVVDEVKRPRGSVRAVERVAPTAPVAPGRSSVAAQLPAIAPAAKKQSQEQPKESPHQPVAVAAKERPSAENARISLLIATLRPGLLLLDTVPATGTSHRQLLTNIARSMGATVADEELFRWPCADHPQLQRDEGAAREAVVGCLMRRLGTASSHDLLLLGAAPHWVNADALSLLGNAVRQAVAAPSLDDMLRSSTAKRQFWKALSALVAN